MKGASGFYVKDFSLEHTFASGQVINFVGEFGKANGMQRLDFYTTRGIFKVSFRPTGGSGCGYLSYEYLGHYTEADARRALLLSLGLHKGVSRIYALLGKDALLAKAISRFYGMRVTQTDPWQTAVCFIASQFNSIKRIRQIVHKLSRKFGERLQDGSVLFPGAESIASSSVRELAECGLGFRAKYVLDFARGCVSSFDLGALYRMKYPQAKEALMSFDGIGDKVADCILLFGYGKQEAFPVDVWIKRIVEKEYFKGRKQSMNAIHKFAEEKFGAYAGYAQQYL
ncbi:MAG: DNA-3-methyladenine glycosylase family protein, partial [Candidatus Micrarchaeia archaeon]